MIHTAKDILFEQTALYTQISSQVFSIHKFLTEPWCFVLIYRGHIPFQVKETSCMLFLVVYIQGLLLFFFFVEQFIRLQQCYVSYHISSDHCCG